MKVIQAINEGLIYSHERTLFLAGGISGCPDWQSELIDILAESDPEIIIINPRRPDFPMGDPKATENQIYWEFRHLKLSTEVAFWFPKETLCPITLYELGVQIHTKKLLYIGTHPEYERRQDVIIQSRLVRNIHIGSSLKTLARRIIGRY